MKQHFQKSLTLFYCQSKILQKFMWQNSFPPKSGNKPKAIMKNWQVHAFGAKLKKRLSKIYVALQKMKKEQNQPNSSDSERIKARTTYSHNIIELGYKTSSKFLLRYII